MGQKQTRVSQGLRPGFSPAAEATQQPSREVSSTENPEKPEKPTYPFRCEDIANIPPEIIEGPFEDFEIANDVYSTAYLIARNSGDMYSIWPWKNKDVLIVWAFLLFIAGSQLFVILSVVYWYPPSVSSESLIVVCSNSTAVRDAFSRGFLTNASKAECLEAGKFSFEADVRGKLRQHFTLERSTAYYNSILREGDSSIYVLRLICCVWVFSQIYLQEFSNVKSLLLYHDFSRWFLQLKGETIRNGWAVCLPLIQYSVVLVVCTVSFMIICAQAEAFDIVMNSLAFTFIAEVGSYFNDPICKRMGATLIKNLPEEDYPDPIYYLYPEYDISNAVYEDGKYTDGGWYLVEDEQKSGMLSDYKIRHNPSKYSKFYSETLGLALERGLFVVPVLCVALGAIRCNWYLGSTDGEARTDL